MRTAVNGFGPEGRSLGRMNRRFGVGGGKVKLRFVVVAVGVIAAAVSPHVSAHRAEPASAQRGEATQSQNVASDTVKALVERLELEKYRATIKGLTQFGDRRQ